MRKRVSEQKGRFLSKILNFLLFLQDTEGHTSVLFRTGSSNGYYKYKGYYLGVAAKAEWNTNSNQWEISVRKRKDKVTLFYSQYNAGSVPPTTEEASWKSRHEICQIAALSTFSSLFSGRKELSAV